MVEISHVIYKADNLEAAVERFRVQGFDVEYGSAKNPRNAVIYFCTGPYLEILTHVRMPAPVRCAFRLGGRHRLVQDMDSVAAMAEGFSRIGLEARREDFESLTALYRRHGLRTVVAPVSRKDPAGRRLSCHCLMPDDWSVPFFVTPFAVDTHRLSAHPNGITRIDEIRMRASAACLDICRRAGAAPRLNLVLGQPAIEVSFA